MTEMDEINNEIDRVLKKFCDNGGKHSVKFDKKGEWRKDYDLLYSLFSDYKLITEIRKPNRTSKLTPLGVKVCTAGGWIEWKRKHERNQIIKRVFFYLGIIGGLLFGGMKMIHPFSNKEKIETIETKEENQEKLIPNQDSIIYDKSDSLTKGFIKRLTTKESDQQSQTHITKTESEESKSHISTSDHENPHSFQDSTTVVF